MANEVWNEGNVVMLKSGGPKMTVAWQSDEYGTQICYCQWFEKLDAKGEKFRPAMLQKAD